MPRLCMWGALVVQSNPRTRAMEVWEKPGFAQLAWGGTCQNAIWRIANQRENAGFRR